LPLGLDGVPLNDARDLPFSRESAVGDFAVAALGGIGTRMGTSIHPTVHFSAGVSSTGSPSSVFFFPPSPRSPPPLNADDNVMCAVGAGRRYEA